MLISSNDSSSNDESTSSSAFALDAQIDSLPPRIISGFGDDHLLYMRQIRLYMPWLIVVPGLLGNLFILMIFMKRARRYTSNGICFSALAIADSLALIFMLLRALLKLHILKNLSMTCKLIKYIYHVSLQLSSWCLVVLTIDRLIAILFVFKYMNWCKRFYSLRMLIVIVLLILVLNAHIVVFRDAKQVMVGKQRSDSPKYTCSVDETRHPFYFKYVYLKWELYHSIVYGAIPFLIIFISNISIIIKLNVLRKNKSFVFKKPLIAANNNNNKRKPDKNLANEDVVEKQLAATKRFVQAATKDPNIRSFQITLMLLAIAVIFLILTAPISIYMPMMQNKLDSKRELIKVILRYIGYTNNAVNFYIYILFSSEFRKEFIATLKSFACSFAPPSLRRHSRNGRKQLPATGQSLSSTMMTTTTNSSTSLKSKRQHKASRDINFNVDSRFGGINRGELMWKFREQNESSEPFILRSHSPPRTPNITGSLDGMNGGERQKRLQMLLPIEVDQRTIKKTVSASHLPINNTVIKMASNRSLAAFHASSSSSCSNIQLKTNLVELNSNNEYILKNKQLNYVPDCAFINTRSSLV